MKKVYVGTSLHNAARAKHIITKFLAAKIAISHDWTHDGQLLDEMDLTYYGVLETNGVRNCDLFFMIQPGRTGTHVELGIAIALNKPIVILEEAEVEKKPFYYQPGIYRFKKEDDALAFALRILRDIP